jgi:hypothetical protein
MQGSFKRTQRTSYCSFSMTPLAMCNFWLVSWLLCNLAPSSMDINPRCFSFWGFMKEKLFPKKTNFVIGAYGHGGHLCREVWRAYTATWLWTCMFIFQEVYSKTVAILVMQSAKVKYSCLLACVYMQISTIVSTLFAQSLNSGFTVIMKRRNQHKKVSDLNSGYSKELVFLTFY